MNPARGIGPDIRVDLLEGMSVKAVMRKYTCSASTVSYHRRMVGLMGSPKAKIRYDWVAIRNAIEGRDLCMSEVRAEFGMTGWSVRKAIKRGDLPELRNGHLEPVTIGSVATKNSTYGRGSIKRRLLASGQLRNHCYNPDCPLHEEDAPMWAGKPLVLHLDHINGVANDHRIENLQMLCANCHGQTHNFAGRNKKYKSIDD